MQDYIRLSKEDKTKDKSNSVTNQNSKDLEIVDFYIDNDILVLILIARSLRELLKTLLLVK